MVMYDRDRTGQSRGRPRCRLTGVRHRNDPRPVTSEPAHATALAWSRAQMCPSLLRDKDRRHHRTHPGHRLDRLKPAWPARPTRSGPATARISKSIASISRSSALTLSRYAASSGAPASSFLPPTPNRSVMPGAGPACPRRACTDAFIALRQATPWFTACFVSHNSASGGSWFGPCRTRPRWTQLWIVMSAGRSAQPSRRPGLTPIPTHGQGHRRWDTVPPATHLASGGRSVHPKPTIAYVPG